MNNEKITWWKTAEKILNDLGLNQNDSRHKGYHYTYLGRISVEKNIKLPNGQYENNESLIGQASWSLTSDVGRTIRGKTAGNVNLFVRESDGFIALKKWSIVSPELTEFTEMSENTENKENEPNLKKKIEITSLNQLLEEIFEETHIREQFLSRLMMYSDSQLEHLVASPLSDIYSEYKCYITRENGRGKQPLGDIVLERTSPISDEFEKIMVEVKGCTDPNKPRKITSKEVIAFAGNLWHQNVHEGIFITIGEFYNGLEEDLTNFHDKGMRIKPIDGSKLVDIWSERMYLSGNE